VKAAIQKICIIGAGNVAWHLGQHAHAQGLEVAQVFSREIAKAEALAQLIGAKALTELSILDPRADLYLLLVKDDAIDEVAARLKDSLPADALVCHGSGATDLAVLHKHFQHCGVFYPLQSFSKNRSLDFYKQVPLCVEATEKAAENLLLDLAKKLSRQAALVSSEQRFTLHLGAVFVNNFVNKLYAVAEGLLIEKDLPFDLLLPLIQETAAKVQDHSPFEMQTGPARRGDLEIQKKQLHSLDKDARWQLIYGMMSRFIAQDYGKGA
jgi:predicted short-subunit dehydrogenase-like oxidoreductase (DUF2520 family)